MAENNLAGSLWPPVQPLLIRRHRHPERRSQNNASNVFSQLASATQQQDLSFQWMQRLFPGTVEFWFFSAAAPVSATGTTTDVLQAVFQILNSILFALGAGIISWHTVQGIVASAHTGKPLGDRWHTIWAPMRVVWGVGNLAPVKG